MPTASAIGSFVKRPPVPGADGAADIWCRLTQEAIPSRADEANLKDLYQMIAAAQAGESAYEYIYDSCPYVVIVDGVVRITLPFFVWPSDLGLAYELTASIGTITAGVAYEEERSFDVIFDHADSYDYEAVFDGELTPEMPFFAADGHQVDTPEITITGSLITLPEPLTTVLRAEGTAYGFRHELVIEVVKAAPATDPNAEPEADPAAAPENPERAVIYSTTNLEAAITVAWVDETGAIQSEIMDMEIPGCVEDLLETCPDSGNFKGDPERPEGELYMVWYSTCNGEILQQRWEDPNK